MSLPAAGYEPYLSFYGRHKISPVRQDISDMNRHFQRRQYLYRYLGLPPLAISGKSVAEFGPGSGYNALYTTYLAPKRYLLVEGNPTGMAQCKKLLHENFPDYSGHEFVASRIQEFTTEERFDTIFCEGVIPHQKDPATFSRHIGTFLRPGGVLVITTADYLSVFPEVLRRVICDTIVLNDAPLAVKVERLVPVFSSHYASLPSASRPIEDWLIDTLLDTWGNPLYSFEEAVTSLSADFEVYGSSPKFLTDWRWYKDLDAASAELNKHAIEQYRAQCLSLVDCRTVLPPQSVKTASAIADLCEQAFWRMIDIRNSPRPDFSAIIDVCSRIVDAAQPDLANIAKPVAEVIVYLRSYKTTDATSCFPTFKSWFGRGQQYVSFIKKAR